MTKPKTRDEMANEYTIHQYKMTFDVPAMHGIQRAYLAGYDAHAAIAKEREAKLWEWIAHASLFIQETTTFDGSRDRLIEDLAGLRKGRELERERIIRELGPDWRLVSDGRQERILTPSESEGGGG